jgi:hypothetical protein
MLQASHHDLPAWATERKRPRQYVIGRRRCRQRLAQGLAAGRSPKALAALNRLGESEVQLLLKDQGFQDLVAHYRTLADLPEAEKLAALRRKALDLMELALDAGDVRVAIFFAYEELHGRDPGMTLAKAAVRAVEREAARTAPVPERRHSPKPQAEPRREADFPYCAATQAGPTEAAAMAAGEVRRFEARIGTTRRSLTGKLLVEAEREGTAETEPLTEKAEAFARDAHGQGGQALAAAAEWQARREAFAEGRPGGPHSAGGVAPAAAPHHLLSWHDLIGPSIRIEGAAPPDQGDGWWAANAQLAPTMDGPVEPGHDSEREGEGREETAIDEQRPGLTAARGGHPQDTATGGSAPPSGPGPREGPAPSARLPDWVDLVPGASRARLLAMPEAVRAETLRVWARFYGFDTG